MHITKEWLYQKLGIYKKRITVEAEMLDGIYVLCESGRITQPAEELISNIVRSSLDKQFSRNYTDKELLRLVRRKGILVERLPKGTKFFDVVRTSYFRPLGAVCKRNLFGVITHVYDVYEDYDGSIKYYDYPQITERRS